MNTEELQYFLGRAGTVAYAVTAVLAVTPRGIDLFGASVMGLITEIGGGTIRDVILVIQFPGQVVPIGVGAVAIRTQSDFTSSRHPAGSYSASNADELSGGGNARAAREASNSSHAALR
ncbi:MAG: TRIC cation channel family protein [Polyangiales bacterium]